MADDRARSSCWPASPIVGGVLNLPFTDRHAVPRALARAGARGATRRVLDVATGTKVGARGRRHRSPALVGIALGRRASTCRSGREPVEPEILAEGWYYDSTITAFMGGPGRAGLRGRRRRSTRTVIDGAVNGVAGAVRGGGTGLRVLQTGFVRSYALGVAVGVVGLLAYFLTRAGV